MAGFGIRVKSLQQVLEETYGNEKEWPITIGDLITIFSDALALETDVVDRKLMEKVVCRDFKNFCHDDREYAESGKIIHGVSHQTQEVMQAMDSKDAQRLKRAYEELKTYQNRIAELENEAYKDELTGAWNRRYLFGQKLGENGEFISSGAVIGLAIRQFKELNAKYGRACGDKILQFLIRSIKDALGNKNGPLIRLAGAEFIILTTPEGSDAAVRKLESIQKSVNGKALHIGDQSIIIDFGYVQRFYTKGETFDTVSTELFFSLS